jgi:hypothetical protein
VSMHAGLGAESIPMASPPEAIRARVRIASIGVVCVALLAGAVVGIRDPQWALLAAAVIFGWSQIAGA